MNTRMIFLVLALFNAACSDNQSVNVNETEPAEKAEPAEQVEQIETVEKVPPPDLNETGTSLTCPHGEQREIFFTSNEIKDTLDIQILGEDCDRAEIVLSIIKSDGSVVHKTTARALDYTYEDVGPAGVERMLERLIISQEFANDLADIDRLTEYNGYYELNRAAAIKARNAGQPLFCHIAGKSYGNCFAYIDGESILLFSAGS